LLRMTEMGAKQTLILDIDNHINGN
jgi:hypothetical protein